MLNGRVESHAAEAEAALVLLSWETTKRIAATCFTALQNALSVRNPGVRRKRTRTTTAGKKGSGYTAYLHPAAHGEPPRMRTGWLRGHVKYDADKAGGVARVGLVANAKYGLYLDRGNHPWFLATLEKIMPQLQAIAKG